MIKRKDKSLKRLVKEKEYLDRKVREVEEERDRDRSWDAKAILLRLKKQKLAIKTAIAKADAGIFKAIDEEKFNENLQQLAQEIENRDQLRAAVLAEMKAQLADARTRLSKRLQAERDGADYVGAHAHALDILIRGALNLARTHIFNVVPKFGVMAVGGYGRGELAPHSDMTCYF